MPRYYTENWTEVENLSLNDTLGVQLRGRTADPTDNNIADGRLYYNSGTNVLRLRSNGAWVNVATGAAGGATPTWEEIYALDTTWAIAAGTFTITQSSTNPIFTLNKTNVGAGAVIAITNSGTGNDVTGNGGNWAFTAAGALTCVSIADSAAGATLQVDGNGAGGVNIGSTSTGAITLGRATTITTGGLTVSDTGITISTGALTVSDTGITVSDGLNDFIDNSNIASALRITNNTVTTFGVGGASTGMVLLRSTSLTTGSLLSLQLAEGALVGGFYLRCFDTTGAGNVFTLGEDGAVVITGAGGSDMLTVTAGDLVVSDGSLTMTDADNANSFSLTNNTVTTANTFTVTGSGVFTGTGASSFFTVVPSGLTTGTALAITAAALTTGTGEVVTANAMTTGIALQLTSSGTITTTGAMLDVVADSATTAGAGGAGRGLVRVSADALTTGVVLDLSSTSVGLAAGQLADFDHTASGAIVAKTAQLVNVTASRDNTAAAAISDDYDVLAIARTNTNTNAGGTLNAAGSCLRLENISTQTAGTLEDTAIGLEVVMTGGVEAQGNAIDITHTGTTVGRALLITSSHTTRDGVAQVTANSVNTGNVIVVDANGLTTGTALELSSTGVITTTGEMLSVIANSATTSTGLIRISATGLTDGFCLEVTGGGANITATGGVFNLDTGASTVGSGVTLTNSGVYTGAGLLRLTANTATTGIGAIVTMNGLTTGTALRVTSSGTITSGGEGLVNLVASGMTTGSALKIDLTEATLTTGNYINCFDDTATASVFTVAEDGVTTIAGAAASTALAITAGRAVLSAGYVRTTRQAVTLGAAATTFATASNVVELTGDGGGNSLSTITAGGSGMVLTLIFTDGNVTVVNDNTHAADTIDLLAGNTTFADDATLTLVHDGTAWYEVTRSVNA